MEVTIHGRHLEVTAEVRTYVEEKFGRVVRLYHGVQAIEVILKGDNRQMHCEAILQIRNKGPVVVDVARDNLTEAIDVAIDKCERQLRRLKEKHTAKRRRTSSRIMRPPK